MDSNVKHTQTQIKKYRSVLQDSNGVISLSSVFNSDRFLEIINDYCDFRHRIYTPLVTLMMFIKQVLNPDKSCKKAVHGFVAERLSKEDDSPPSTNTGPYCKARMRLPESMFHELVQTTGASSTAQTPQDWKVFGREVKSIDGTTIKMADTVANQNEYPQHNNQAKGAGFPIIRLVAVMSLTMGTVLGYAIGAYKGKGTGEQSLFRSIIKSINKDDIVLADRYYPSYFFMADIHRIGADTICQAQAQRHCDFRKGKKLGSKDHLVSWSKPPKPKLMEQSEYDSYPSEIIVREFMVSGVAYVTTFINPKTYNKRELAEIYKSRWDIEVNLRHIKTTMNMDMLSCKTPDMIKKEIGAHFLGYNVIRILMAEACQKHGFNPRKVSFKGTIQLINDFMPYLVNSNKSKVKRLYAQLLELIVKNKIGNRPGRVEPRMVKQRPKAFQPLKGPRNIEKEKLIKMAEKRSKKYAYD